MLTLRKLEPFEPRLHFIVRPISIALFCEKTLDLLCDGVSPSGKAAVFGTATRRFESFHPN